MNISQVQQHLVQTVENTNPQMAAKSMRMCCTGLERPDYLGLFPIVFFNIRAGIPNNDSLF